MIYLTFPEYIEIGGTLDVSAFNRNIDRACGVIDDATHNRVERMKDIPRKVKVLCRDLVEYLSVNRNVSSRNIVSWSESAGVISNSESYENKTANDIYFDIQSLLYDYLDSEIDDNGTPLLYKGAST